MDDKTYFIGFLLITAILIGGLAAISFIEDPAHRFNSHYEEGIAEILFSGANVANINNYDERVLQKEIIQRGNRSFDVIVLGSSRSMQINHKCEILSDNNSFFNHAVSGGTLEDYIAILALYLGNKEIPEEIIIGVDPWIFNKNNQQNRWMSLKDEYQKGLDIIYSGKNLDENRTNTPPYKYINYKYSPYLSLISRPIILKSIQMLVFSDNDEYYPTKLEEGEIAIKLTDGSLSYPNSSENNTISDIDAMAIDYANSNPIYSLGNYNEVDEGLKASFEQTIRYLKSKNAEIVLYLPSYHPIVYEKIKSDPKYSNVLVVESYLKEFSKSENITCIGSYDPEKLNLTSEDFYDGMHPSRRGTEKIFTLKI